MRILCISAQLPGHLDWGGYLATAAELARRGHEVLWTSGIAVAERTYKAYRTLLGSRRWLRAYNAGARPQRLLWASTGAKDPKVSDTLYIQALAGRSP